MTDKRSSTETVRCAECGKPVDMRTEWTGDNQWGGLTLYCSWACRDTHFDGEGAQSG